MGQKRERTIDLASFGDGDKECLVRLVKELAKEGATGDKGDFKAWLKATQKGAKRTTHDPSKHDWDVLSSFVQNVASARARWTDVARRHLGWSRWAERRAAWKRWNDDAPPSVIPTTGPWALAARTSAHATYDETYGSLPSHAAGWVRSVKQRPPRWCVEKNLAPRLVALDCEMCETTSDARALIGVSVVDERGKVLLKTLVKPPGVVVDYKTDVTGLSAKDFTRVTTTLADVQRELVSIVTAETILVGHGLVHDLRALKFHHAPVIDTAMLFEYENLPRSTPGLADLCKRLLGVEMRKGGDGAHDSVEDAKAAMELCKWEAVNGPSAPLTPPEDKVDPRDLLKLFAHRVKRGTLKSDLIGMFAKNNGTTGVDHADDIEAVHGKFLGPETSRELAPGAPKTTTAYIEFKTIEACNMAFKALRGATGTDALGRPQKAVKMVVHDHDHDDDDDDASGGDGKKRTKNKTRSTEELHNGAAAGVSKMKVTALKEELKRRGLATTGLKAALIARLTDAIEAGGDDDGGSSDGGSSDGGGEEEKKRAPPRTETVMVRKMAAHGGSSFGTKDKSASAAARPAAAEDRPKQPRRVPRPSKRKRMEMKGLIPARG